MKIEKIKKIYSKKYNMEFIHVKVNKKNLFYKEYDKLEQELYKLGFKPKNLFLTFNNNLLITTDQGNI